MMLDAENSKKQSKKVKEPERIPSEKSI